MKTKNNVLGKIIFGSGLALALTLAAYFPGAARAAEHDPKMGKMPAGAMPGAMPPMSMMNHIKTQAEAEALKPGDSMSMTCTKCKTVMVQKVGTDQAHVKMMTIGQKTDCSECGGTAEVVGTGKGQGKNEEVKHVCTKCGDDAMFCSATKPGSGSMPPMKMK